MTFLDEVRKKLDLPSAEKEQVMRELESHYHEVEDEALSTGMNECEASAEAAKRLGDPSDIAQRMQAANCRVTWKIAILTALPFFLHAAINVFVPLLGKLGIQGSLYNMIWAYTVFLAGTILISVSIREIRADRRPFWLATWLPMGVGALSGVMYLALDKFRHVSIYYSNNGAMESIAGLTGYVMVNAIPIFITGLLAIWICWKQAKWTPAIIGIIALIPLLSIWISPKIIMHLDFAAHVNHAAVDFPIIAGGFHIIDAIIILACAFISLLLAITLFVKHPYGNKIQASLMLYTFLSLTSKLINNQSSTCYILTAIISGLAILLFARATKWQIKQWILCIAVTISGMMGVIISLSAPNALPFNNKLVSVPAITIMAYITWILFVPEMVDRYYKKRNPEFAR